MIQRERNTWRERESKRENEGPRETEKDKTVSSQLRASLLHFIFFTLGLNKKQCNMRIWSLVLNRLCYRIYLCTGVTYIYNQ